MPVNTILLSTHAVALGQSVCGVVPVNRTDEEVETHFTVVFPISGIFVVDIEGRRTIGSPTKLLLFSMAEDHEIRHPFGGHDRSAFITMNSDVVEPFLSASGKFPKSASLTTSHIDLAVRQMLAQAKRGQLSSLGLEEFTNHVLCLQDKQRSDSTFDPEPHRSLVVDTEEYLSVNFRRDCDLRTIARQVGSSSHHLSRVFKRLTGESISRRRLRMRLVSALAEITEGADDLSRVAVEAGFYDHSHMTNSFRASFGMSPKDARSSSALSATSLQPPR